MAAGDNTPLGEVTLGEFTKAISDAVATGMSSTGTVDDKKDLKFDSLGNEIPGSKDVGRKKSIESLEKNMSSFLKSAGVSTDKLFEKTGKTLTQLAAEQYDYQQKRADANKAELAYIYDARKQIGGISIIPDEQGQIAEGITKKVLDQAEAMFKRGTDAYESTVKFQGALANFKVSDLFEDGAEGFMTAYTELMSRFVTDMPGMAADLTDDMAETLLGFQKSLSISEQDMSDILKRQYAFTGEANADVLGEIANVSKVLADQVGTGANKLKKEIVAIITDVDRFGNIGVDAAGRISAALAQTGVDFNTFVRLTDQFMRFDSAADKMGELSALFGIQMDAMEMTYLANEDQEEFLFRMREEIMDAGIDVENMSNARARALAGQLNMNVSQMKMFLREGELAVDQAEMTATTDATESMDGLTTAAGQFGDVFASSSKDAMTAFKESIIPSIMESKAGLMEAHKASAELGKEMRKFEFDEDSTIKMQESIQAATETRIAAIDLQTIAATKSLEMVNTALSTGVKISGDVVKGAAKLGGKGVDLVAGKAQGLEGGVIRSQRREISKDVADLNKTISIVNQNNATRVAKMEEGNELAIARGEEGKFGFDQATLDQIREVPVKIQIDLDGDMLAETTATVYRRNGQELVVVPVGEGG